MMIETKTYIIKPSNSHEDCWIFKVKGTLGFFMITASEEYIRETYEDKDKER